MTALRPKPLPCFPKWTTVAVAATASTTALYVLLTAFILFFAFDIARSYLFAPVSTWRDGMPAQLLPGLNEPFFPAFGMYLHWVGGFLISLIGSVQLFPWTRKHILLHRMLGTVYIASSVLAFVGGQIFIFSHGCVGGTNMNIAFSAYGWTLLVCAGMTYYKARVHQRVAHRNWAIRLWSQGIASALYRVWLALLALCGYDIVRVEDFQRPLDQACAWWFFVPNLLVAELTIYALARADARAAPPLTWVSPPRASDVDLGVRLATA